MFDKWKRSRGEREPGAERPPTAEERKMAVEQAVYDALLTRNDFLRAIEIQQYADSELITPSTIFTALDRLYSRGAILKRRSLLDRAVIVTNAVLDFPDFDANRRAFNPTKSLGLNKDNWMTETLMYAALRPDGSWPSFIPEGIEPFVRFEVPIIDLDI